ncbi:MAG: hypothetical protein AB7P12_14050 [Alphaproteobacteria bacterium]
MEVRAVKHPLLDPNYVRQLIVTVPLRDGRNAIYPFGSCRRGYLIPAERAEDALWSYARRRAATTKFGLLGMLAYSSATAWASVRASLAAAKNHVPDQLQGEFLGFAILGDTHWQYWLAAGAAMCLAALALRLIAAWSSFSRFPRTSGPAPKRIYAFYRRVVRNRPPPRKPLSIARSIAGTLMLAALVLVVLLWLSKGILDLRVIIVALMPFFFILRTLVEIAMLPLSIRREVWTAW